MDSGERNNILLDLFMLKVRSPCRSVGNMQDFKTGGRWLDPRLGDFCPCLGRKDADHQHFLLLPVFSTVFSYRIVKCCVCVRKGLKTGSVCAQESKNISGKNGKCWFSAILLSQSQNLFL